MQHESLYMEGYFKLELWS